VKPIRSYPNRSCAEQIDYRCSERTLWPMTTRRTNHFQLSHAAVIVHGEDRITCHSPTDYCCQSVSSRLCYSSIKLQVRLRAQLHAKQKAAVKNVTQKCNLFALRSDCYCCRMYSWLDVFRFLRFVFFEWKFRATDQSRLKSDNNLVARAMYFSGWWFVNVVLNDANENNLCWRVVMFGWFNFSTSLRASIGSGTDISTNSLLPSPSPSTIVPFETH
jgi:hypothetical protein